jgi:hypothetical protein
MPDEKLTIPQTAVMITLMGEGRPLSNTEMKETHGLVLDGKNRRRLLELGYVTSTRTKGNAPFVNELTDAGWRWCHDELSAGRPRSSREESLGKALYAVLGGLARYLEHVGKAPAEIFYIEPAESLEDRIRATYEKLAKRPGDYVSLTELRRGLDGAPRAEVDEALRELNRGRKVILVSDDEQELLTQEDRAAALRIGNQDKHLLAIEPR